MQHLDIKLVIASDSKPEHPAKFQVWLFGVNWKEHCSELFKHKCELNTHRQSAPEKC